jgi:hypothetical protein
MQAGSSVLIRRTSRWRGPRRPRRSTPVGRRRPDGRRAIPTARHGVALPNVAFLVPGPRHLDIAFALLTELGTAANFTTDGQLAPLAIEHGAEMYSNDTDFGRFPNLQWVNPLR